MTISTEAAEAALKEIDSNTKPDGIPLGHYVEALLTPLQERIMELERERDDLLRQRDETQAFVRSCADTPLMKDVLADRDRLTARCEQLAGLLTGSTWLPKIDAALAAQETDAERH